MTRQAAQGKKPCGQLLLKLNCEGKTMEISVLKSATYTLCVLKSQVNLLVWNPDVCSQWRLRRQKYGVSLSPELFQLVLSKKMSPQVWEHSDLHKNLWITISSGNFQSFAFRMARIFFTLSVIHIIVIYLAFTYTDQSQILHNWHRPEVFRWRQWPHFCWQPR